MNKINIKRTAIALGAISLIILSALSCSIPKSDSNSVNTKISSLESKLSLLQAANAQLESQHKSEIEALESIIKDLQAHCQYRRILILDILKTNATILSHNYLTFYRHREGCV